MTLQVLSLFVGTVLPLVVGAVTTRMTDPEVKACLLAFLSALTAFLTEWLVAVRTAEHFDWGSVGFTALGTFLTAVGMHYGLFKHTRAGQFVQDKVLVTGRRQ